MSTPLPAGRVRRSKLTVSDWLDRVMSSRAAKEAGVVQRQMKNMPGYVHLDDLRDEVTHRGILLIHSHDRFVFICHGGPISIYR